MDDFSKLRGDEGPTFLSYISQQRTCMRCGADFTAHGPRLECPAWAIDAKLEAIKKKEGDL
jgi:hypothetical protein